MEISEIDLRRFRREGEEEGSRWKEGKEKGTCVEETTSPETGIQVESFKTKQEEDETARPHI